MTHYPLRAPALTHHPIDAVHATLGAFPIACFSLTLLTDIAYWQTSNLLWLHFSEWLLFAGVVMGALALIVRAVDWLVRRVRHSWWAVLGAVVVLVLATVNSLVHTADGWTAVVPWGLTLSVVTILAMIVTAWLAGRGVHHV